jgi:hypothetical protein
MYVPIDEVWQRFETDETEGNRSMTALRDGFVHFIKVNSAVSCIQRHFRKVASDPDHPLCRKRLREEFESDEDGIVANTKRVNH